MANAPPRDGGEGNRTPDLLNAIQALSQLSYAPGRDTLANGSPERAPASEGVRNAQSSRVYDCRQAELAESHWRKPPLGVSCLAPPVAPVLFATADNAGRGIHVGSEGMLTGADVLAADRTTHSHSRFIVRDVVTSPQGS